MLSPNWPFPNSLNPSSMQFVRRLVACAIAKQTWFISVEWQEGEGPEKHRKRIQEQGSIDKNEQQNKWV